ncbi:MAG TPA: diaminopimelate epimerase [Geminicoccaceae bacterium]
MSELRFRKMHGLGNDFVVLDRRAGRLVLLPEQVQRIADRRFGIGCDQLLSIEPSDRAEAFMRVYNADGSTSGACGNGTRCVGRLLMEETGRNEVRIETEAGILTVRANLIGYTVDMGRPRFGWDEIPLAEEMDTLELDLALGPLEGPTALNLGNPHVVFFVADVEAVPLEELGPQLECHPLFPERANIGVAEVRDEETIRLRVFERGVGLTTACGSGACAALVAAARRGIAGPKANLLLDGGRLQVHWAENGRVLMTGPASLSYTGELAPELLAIA